MSTHITETTSGIVFERPVPSAGPPEDRPVAPPAPPTSADDGKTEDTSIEARKHWGGGEGAAPLVAMLQEKTLQTATYAVPNATTQSM